MHPKVLIVGTVPYNKKSTSRAFESYFSGWEKENLAQIFSNVMKPTKGHCGTLYQITDQQMLKRHLCRTLATGTIYHFDELTDERTDINPEGGNPLVSKLYILGHRSGSLIKLLRKMIWKKRFWCTPVLNKWLDDFNPECVFLSFSDDYFISEIALYVAQRYGIPIVSSIGDDYYFNTKRTQNPFYHIYKKTYRRLIDRVLAHKGSAIYINDKIRDKYNCEFMLDGETVYLTSEFSRRDFRPINLKSPQIAYCGNIRGGRNYSLNDIAIALGKISKNYFLDIYSNETDCRNISVFSDNPNVRFHGSVAYAKVQSIMQQSDINIVVEGFSKADIALTRYSLSTKIADSLASGASIFAYGSHECGAIEYAKSTGCITTCTDRTKLEDALRSLLSDVKLQERHYYASIKVFEKNHKLQSSTAVFLSVIRNAIAKGDQVCLKKK